MIAANDGPEVRSTALGAFAANVAEGAWLAALVVVPLLFNVHTVRIFEEEKVPLLRSLAVVIAVATTVWALEAGRASLRAGRRLWSLPVVRLAAVLTGAQLLATATSVAPSVSFWGGYTRAQGAYTWLSYLVIFVAALLFAGERARRERVITAVLLGSLPVALYAILQHAGVEPVAWRADAGLAGRVSSTAGNPIFLGAYLIMVIPLTGAHLAEQVIGTGRSGPRAAAARRVRCLVAAGLLGVQMLALLYTGSRGPLLGLCGGAIVAALVVGIRAGARWIAPVAAALGGGGTLLLLLLNLPDTPLAPLRDIPHLGRLGRILDVGPGEGGGRVRLLIWEGTARLLAAHPMRLATGYGPETLLDVLPPYLGTDLARLEGRNAAPDRCHNDTFDALVHTGVIGAGAGIALFLALVGCGLQRLGVIDSPAQRRAVIGAAVLGGIAGAGGARLLDGGFRLVGIALPVGVVAGVVASLIARAATGTRRSDREPRGDAALRVGLLAAIVAHFVEIQVGFATTTSRLYFWSYAALMLAVGHGHSLPAAARAADHGQEGAAPAARRWVAVTTIVALILITLTFDFVHQPHVAATLGPAVAGLLASVWALGCVLVAADDDDDGGWLDRIGAYTGLSIGLWLSYVVLHTWRIASPALDAVAAADLLADAAAAYYAAVFIVVAVGAGLSAAPAWSGRAPRGAARWRPVLYVLLAIAAVFVIVTANLDLTRAAVFARVGDRAAGQGRWDAARRLYEEAHRLWPRAARYPSATARALVAQATAAADPDARRRLLAAATAEMARALRLDPRSPDNLANLASVYRARARLSDDPAEQARAVGRAEASYRRAVRASPGNPTLYTEWARLYLDQHDHARALATLALSLQLDASDEDAYVLRGQIAIDSGAFAAAAADFDRALAINKTSSAAWRGKALALSRLGRAQEAIESGQAAVAAAPDDPDNRRALALLYRDAGQRELALAEATVALALARPEERESMRALVAALEAARRPP